MDRETEIRLVQERILLFHKACFETCCKKLFGKVRDPANEWEAEDLANAMKAIEDRSQLFHYTPHEKQARFLNGRCRLKAACTGNQFGKTRALLSEILSWCIGFRPWDLRLPRRLDGSIVRGAIRACIGAENLITSVGINIWPKLVELVPEEIFFEATERMQGVVHKVRFKREWGGSELKFMSYSADYKSWEGPTWDIVGFDEPHPYAVHTATERGCVAKDAPIILSMTLLNEPWIADELLDGPNVVDISESDEAVENLRRENIAVVWGSIHDNPHLNQDRKQEFIDGMDPDERETREWGRPKSLSGRIYKEFDPERHVLKDETLEGIYGTGQPWREWPAGVVIDPHDRRPYAIGIFVITPLGERIWVSEWPDFDFASAKDSSMEVGDYASWIQHELMSMRLRARWWIMDPRFGATPKATTKTTLIDEFRREGLYFNENFDAGPIEVGRKRVKSALKRGKLLFLPQLHNFRRALKFHAWDDYRDAKERGAKEKEKEKFKDFCDVLRYAEMADTYFFTDDWEQDLDRVPMNLGMERR